jgi:hypothetical protein
MFPLLPLDLIRSSGFCNRGAHLRSGRRAEGTMDEPAGEEPCSGAMRRDKAERSDHRDSRRRSRREQVILQFL